MRDVFIKLRGKFFICRLQLKIFCSKITEPFQAAIARIKLYLELRKIDKESKDRWERHVKIREIDGKNELKFRRNQFNLLKTQLIGVFFRTCICAGCHAGLQEQPNEVDNFRKEFQKNKEELVGLLEKLCNYDEITFDEEIKSGIVSWEFGKFKTQEELTNWEKSFSEYICTLDII